jgi:hypothetical protein
MPVAAAAAADAVIVTVCRLDYTRGTHSRSCLLGMRHGHEAIPSSSRALVCMFAAAQSPKIPHLCSGFSHPHVEFLCSLPPAPPPVSLSRFSRFLFRFLSPSLSHAHLVHTHTHMETDRHSGTRKRTAGSSR